MTIWASRIRLTDTEAPRFTREPSGALAQPGAALDGERGVTFAASRPRRRDGLGRVRRRRADPRRAATQVPVTTCARPYVAVVPCPSSIERTMTLDTTEVANGKHSFQMALTDAAGNRTLSSPVEIEVRNRGVPNGAGATQFAKLDAWLASRGTARRTAGVVSYGRTRSITGRLSTPDGAPIVGAALDVSATTGRPGSRAKVIGQVVTDGNGAFSSRPRAGSSRRISVSYRAYTLDAAASAVSDVVLQTRAGMRLTVSPKRVRSRGTIRFTGRLLRRAWARGHAGRHLRAREDDASRIPVSTVQGRFARAGSAIGIASATARPARHTVSSATLHAQRSYPYATGQFTCRHRAHQVGVLHRNAFPGSTEILRHPSADADDDRARVAEVVRGRPPRGGSARRTG